MSKLIHILLICSITVNAQTAKTVYVNLTAADTAAMWQQIRANTAAIQALNAAAVKGIDSTVLTVNSNGVLTVMPRLNPVRIDSVSTATQSQTVILNNHTTMIVATNNSLNSLTTRVTVSEANIVKLQAIKIPTSVTLPAQPAQTIPLQ